MTNLLKDDRTFDIKDIHNLLRNIDARNKDIHDELKQMRREVNEEFQEIKKKISDLENENTELNSQLQNINKKLRKYSFVIFGLVFPENELVNAFMKLVNEVLNVKITTNDLRDIYTLSNKKIIHVELISYLKKREIFSNLGKLKGSKISFAHDMSLKERKENKVLVTYLKEARSRKFKAKIINNKLLVGGETYTYSELVEHPIEFDNLTPDKVSEEQDTATLENPKEETSAKLQFTRPEVTVEEGPKTRGKKNTKNK